MKPEHVLAWANSRLAYWNNRLVELNALYEVYRVKYDSKPIHKFLGWTFDNSSAGNTSYWSGKWEFWLLEERIKTLEALTKEARYNVKTNKERMAIELENRKAFYAWCDKEKIPY